jgi:hypothetical protein
MSNQGNKERKKEFRKFYEKKLGVEWVKWVQNQPTYSPFEWVEYMSENRN